MRGDLRSEASAGSETRAEREYVRRGVWNPCESTMCQEHSGQLDPATETRLRRIARIHRLNFHLFCIGMVLIFGGFAMLIVFGTWAAYVISAGFAVGGAVLLQACFVYPFLRCPRCGHRFFLPDGPLSLITRIDSLRKECLHCGLSFRSSTTTNNLR